LKIQLNIYANLFSIHSNIIGRQDKNAKNEIEIGKKAVLTLTEPFFNTQRNVCFDNFFTSVSLAEALWVKQTTCIGTIRSNKAEVPSCFLKNNRKEIESSMFAFKDHLTLISYVPAKNKVVLLISTYHHDKKVIISEPSVRKPQITKKPEIIYDYNKYKGGVDTFDHLIELNTCRRRTFKWTFNVFMFLVDTAVQNSFSLALMRMKERGVQYEKTRIKDKLVEELCTQCKNLLNVRTLIT
jgi:hypothetical protein